jgi:hypothetical protein
VFPLYWVLVVLPYNTSQEAGNIFGHPTDSLPYGIRSSVAQNATQSGGRASIHRTVLAMQGAVFPVVHNLALLSGQA